MVEPEPVVEPEPAVGQEPEPESTHLVGDVVLPPKLAEALNPEALRALTFDPSTSPASTGSRRGCRIAILMMGVIGFIGIAVLGVMLGQVRKSTPGAAAGPVPDVLAKTSLTTTAQAAQSIAAQTTTLASADPVALTSAVGDLTFVTANAPSTQAKAISVRNEPTLFIAAATGTSGTCWFVRVSSDPVTPGVTWNRVVSTQSCAASVAPLDGWTPEPPG